MQYRQLICIFFHISDFLSNKGSSPTLFTINGEQCLLLGNTTSFGCMGTENPDENEFCSFSNDQLIGRKQKGGTYDCEVSEIIETSDKY